VIILGCGFSDLDIIEVQPLQEVLVGATANSEHEVLLIYNDYAYKVGFSIRYSKIRHRCKFKGVGLCMHQFCCWKAGFKQETSQGSYECRCEDRLQDIYSVSYR